MILEATQNNLVSGNGDKFDGLEVDMVDTDTTVDDGEPEFPMGAVSGFFKDYIETVGENSETPIETHFSVCSSYLSLRLGRNVHCSYPRPLYPCLWSCNVSRSGNRRSTGLDYVYDLSAALAKNKFIILSTVASAEGLIAQFGEFVKYWKQTVWRPEPQKQLLISLNEATTIFKVGKRQSTSNLRETLNDFYDFHSRINNPTKRGSIFAQDPCLSIVSATTYGALRECFKEAEVTSGFLNRWCFFISNQVKHVAIPTAPNPEAMESLKKTTSEMCSFAESVKKEQSGKMRMDEEASRKWEAIYHKYRDAEGTLDDLQGDMVKRIHVFAIKYAMLYAIMDHRYIINIEDISKGDLIADYLWKSALFVLRKLTNGETKFTRLENRILEFLKKNRGNQMSFGYIRRELGSYYSRREIFSALEILVKSSEVDKTPDQRWGIV